MNKLQKDFIRNIIITIVVIILAGLFLVLCKKYPIILTCLANGIAILIIIVIVSYIVYYVVSSLVRDYKIRGILTKEEYKLYSDTEWHYIWYKNSPDPKLIRIRDILLNAGMGDITE